MKDFITQLNDMIAPMTRAYSDPKILSVKIAPGDIQDEFAEVALTVRVKRNAVVAEASQEFRIRSGPYC